MSARSSVSPASAPWAKNVTTDGNDPDANQPRCVRLQKIILLPGLLEPAVVFAPLAWRLRRRCDEVLIWPDRMIFRNLKASVDRLAEQLADVPSGAAVGLVTHSFGDWVARQAIARNPNHRVVAVVSLTPALSPGLLPWLLYLTSGRLIPEVAVMFDRHRCCEHLSLRDPSGNQSAPPPRRLVIWSRIDESVRRVSLAEQAHIGVETYWATHMTIGLRPLIGRRIERFLFKDSVDSGTRGQSRRVF